MPMQQWNKFILPTVFTGGILATALSINNEFSKNASQFIDLGSICLSWWRYKGKIANSQRVIRGAMIFVPLIFYFLNLPYTFFPLSLFVLYYYNAYPSLNYKNLPKILPPFCLLAKNTIIHYQYNTNSYFLQVFLILFMNIFANSYANY